MYVQFYTVKTVRDYASLNFAKTRMDMHIRGFSECSWQPGKLHCQ